ncbi:hypothetical protein SAMN05444411_103225 [Lutibacter oricola]|uniref:Lipoprotein n=1 Tax=Lutibacter oricola TaxID=762486 RepID=A0A1H2ZEG0_9FLAO|nr:hypothetical protein [Lutibacter oricola]SDX15756.1 hypothetical protein SAMN05444411_103225 [Lutibacter oricola]
MKKRFIFTLITVLFLTACSDKGEPALYNNLETYVELNSTLELDEVIACAASDKTNNNISYIFYYPIPGATDIQYFETTTLEVNPNDFSQYFPIDYQQEPVFNGYLERFVRDSDKEVWSIVTYITNGKLHKSNPIRLKHQTKPTEWTSNVNIDFTESTMPKFSWEDGTIKENAIYFEVISDEDNNLLSGTYTYDKWFQYYNLSNTVLNVTRTTPPNLIVNNEYNFTLMAVSEDNWVNLVIQKTFTAE